VSRYENSAYITGTSLPIHSKHWKFKRFFLEWVNYTCITTPSKFCKIDFWFLAPFSAYHHHHHHHHHHCWFRTSRANKWFSVLCFDVPELERRKEDRLSWLAFLIFSFIPFRWNLARYLKIGHSRFRRCSSQFIIQSLSAIRRHTAYGVTSASLSM
jgi:hypothetical protein